MSASAHRSHRERRSPVRYLSGPPLADQPQAPAADRFPSTFFLQDVVSAHPVPIAGVTPWHRFEAYAIIGPLHCLASRMWCIK